MASELSSCVKVEVAAMGSWTLTVPTVSGRKATFKRRKKKNTASKHARTEHETCPLRIKNKHLSLDSDDFGLLLLA